VGIRNRKKEELQRLEWKTLNVQFRTIVEQGLNCSPFEAEAVLQVVQEVYFPFLDQASAKAPPGKITLVAVCADEPAGKPVAECEKRTVCLTVHRGAEDDRLLQTEGAKRFRQARIPDLCQEALSQGAVLTREDLAYRIFFVATRTISRDLAVLRRADPTRLTHRVETIRLALQGKTTTQICQTLRHSPQAVANYLSTFTRCAQLADKGMQVGQIAFLLNRGESLIQRYLELLKECKRDANTTYHLEALLRLGRGEREKKERNKNLS
jgi:DNA-binding CsgD family transcriptional regulator